MHDVWVLRLVRTPLLPFMTMRKGENRGKGKQKKEVKCNDSLLFLFIPPVEIQGKM